MDISTHLISPSKVLRGQNAWEKGKVIIPKICKSPMLLGRSQQTLPIRNSINLDLRSLGVNCYLEELKFDCCYEDLKRLKVLLEMNKCDGVIATGGGKVLDAGKLLAEQLSIPIITIPLSASTCAGWTALSNIYSPEGSFIKDIELQNTPNLLIFDHTFVRQAPSRTLASGVADALAKWYEASISCGSSNDGLVQQAVQMARVLRDQLFIDAKKAFDNPYSESWVRVAEGCALTAGLIGGIGGSKCRSAGAHALHNGITQLKINGKVLHGEMVGLGILVQLDLEEKKSSNQLAAQAKKQLVQLMSDIQLPISIDDLNLPNINKTNLRKACKFSCMPGSDLYNLPFNVEAEELYQTLINCGKEVSSYILSSRGKSSP